MEVNRYTPGHIRLEGDGARNKRITGTFDADDPDSLVQFLGKLDDLAIDPKPDGFLIRER
jgi:transmembrane sensor